MSEESKELGIFEFKPEIFDPNKEQLLAIASEVKNITADPTKITKEELSIVNETKNKLVKARTRIQEVGKAARSGAVLFQKKVIAYEKELIDIIEPEEQRLKDIEKASKDYAIKEERKKKLPEYHEKLSSIGDQIEVIDAELLEMDPTQFQEYYNERLSTKLEADKELARLEAERITKEQEEHNAKVKAEQEAAAAKLKADEEAAKARIAAAEEEANARIKAEQEKLEAEKRHQEEVRAAEQRAREEEQRKAEQAKAQEEAARKADEENRKRKEDELKQQEAARIQKEKEAEEARQQEQKYNQWLSENSYNKETDILDFKDGVTKLYRIVSSFKH